MKFPKIETLVIFIFFGCVALWAVSKCSTERADFVRHVREIGGSEQEERPARRDTVVAPPPVNTPNPSLSPQPQPPVTAAPMPSNPSPQPGAKPSRPTLSNQPTPSAPPPSSGNYSILYVTIDGLKVRKEPSLKSETVAKLELYEPVTFLNKKTDWTQEISLGYEKVTDHWVNIRTQSGKEGWVFGAGVHYYKMKRQGVMD